MSMSTATKTAETMPLVSVIIPIYNVEKYLKECVDSVLNQTYRNLEIILVDNGSPDGCGAMCDTYAAQDDRVRVIHKTNDGQSSAQNTVLEVISWSELFRWKSTKTMSLCAWCPSCWILLTVLFFFILICGGSSCQYYAHMLSLLFRNHSIVSVKGWCWRIV